MAGNPKSVLEKIQAAEVAWGQLAPERRLADMSLEEFRALIAPSFAARERIAQLQNELLEAQAERDRADQVSLAARMRVVAAVLADAALGPDSALYEAMGYTRKSERRSGLTRKSKGAAPPGEGPKPKAGASS